jgi:hypothetical protein
MTGSCGTCSGGVGVRPGVGAGTIGFATSAGFGFSASGRGFSLSAGGVDGGTEVGTTTGRGSAGAGAGGTVITRGAVVLSVIHDGGGVTGRDGSGEMWGCAAGAAAPAPYSAPPARCTPGFVNDGS